MSVGSEELPKTPLDSEKTTVTPPDTLKVHDVEIVNGLVDSIKGQREFDSLSSSGASRSLTLGLCRVVSMMARGNQLTMQEIARILKGSMDIETIEPGRVFTTGLFKGWTVVEKVGEGSQGNVFLAKDGDGAKKILKEEKTEEGERRVTDKFYNLEDENYIQRRLQRAISESGLKIATPDPQTDIDSYGKVVAGMDFIDGVPIDKLDPRKITTNQLINMYAGLAALGYVCERKFKTGGEYVKIYPPSGKECIIVPEFDLSLNDIRVDSSTNKISGIVDMGAVGVPVEKIEGITSERRKTLRALTTLFSNMCESRREEMLSEKDVLLKHFYDSVLRKIILNDSGGSINESSLADVWKLISSDPLIFEKVDPDLKGACAGET